MMILPNPTGIKTIFTESLPIMTKPKPYDLYMHHDISKTLLIPQIVLSPTISICIGKTKALGNKPRAFNYAKYFIRYSTIICTG
mgnify:CR=1 FL=1